MIWDLITLPFEIASSIFEIFGGVASWIIRAILAFIICTILLVVGSVAIVFLFALISVIVR